MKAWGLTSSIPCNKCDKNCPYCISEMTGFIKSDPELVNRNMKKVLRIANKCEAGTFLITSKRETMLNMEMVLKMSRTFGEMIVEIQTNGIWLSRNPEAAKDLYKAGVNNIAFSVDRLDDLEKYAGIFARVEESRMIVRICLNLTDMIPKEMSFADIFGRIKRAGNIRQLLVRNVSIPSSVKSGRQYEWIKEHADYYRYMTLAQEFDRIVEKEGKKPLQIFPFGFRTYGHEGISVGFSDYCIQESNRTDDIRSLIFLEDGHLYTSWSDPASIIL